MQSVVLRVLAVSTIAPRIGVFQHLLCHSDELPDVNRDGAIIIKWPRPDSNPSTNIWTFKNAIEWLVLEGYPIGNWMQGQCSPHFQVIHAWTTSSYNEDVICQISDDRSSTRSVRSNSFIDTFSLLCFLNGHKLGKLLPNSYLKSDSSAKFHKNENVLS